MNQPHYAWRLWRLDPNPRGRTADPAREIRPGLTSVSPDYSWWIDLRSDVRYVQWETRRLEAACGREKHSAPQQNCSCGIYAYPDLLDVLKLIPQYCDDAMYAVGLIEGYGAKHNDGEIMIHDACLRFADVDIVGFAQLGSGWRTGVLQRVADYLDVPVLPLADLQETASKGDKITRKQLAGGDAVFLDALASGPATVAPSAVVVDRYGRVYLRNDREAWIGREDDKEHRLVVSRTPSGRFSVYQKYMSDQGLFLLLPFDGDSELRDKEKSLAGEVAVLKNRSGVRFSNGADDGPVLIPPIDRYHLIDTLEIGRRLPVSAGIEFAQYGRPYLGRVVREDDPARQTPARAFLTRLDAVSFGLELEGEGLLCMQRTVADNRRRMPNLRMDTPVSRLSINGRAVADAELPWDQVDTGGVDWKVNLGLA